MGRVGIDEAHARLRAPPACLARARRARRRARTAQQRLH
jgi:hypothetical protein